LKQKLETDQDFLSDVITADVSWCYGYNPDKKQQSGPWKMPSSPCPKKKSHQVKSNIKTMLICFFDAKGIVHSEIVPPSQTVNQIFYLEVLKRLHNSLCKKSPDLWQTRD